MVVSDNPYDDPEYRFVQDWVKELLQADPEDPLTIQLENMRYDVARTLQRVRYSAGMAQAMVAEASGLKQSMVARLENLKYPANPTLDTLVKYLDVLGAELIISAVRGPRVFLSDAAAERVIVLSDDVIQQAADRGLTPTNYVMYCLSRTEAADAAEAAEAEAAKANEYSPAS